jgi:uncharacterized membrane protein YhaH (DUF805 family)
MTELSPIDWATRPLQKYADFSGRAPRAEYWWFFLGIILAYIVLSIVESIVGLDGMIAGVYGPLTVLMWIVTFVPQLAVGARRLHDTNRTGWWLLAPILPYAIGIALAGPAILSGSMAGLGTAGLFFLIGAVAAIVLLVFMVLPGTTGDNDYGPDPYAGAAMARSA